MIRKHLALPVFAVVLSLALFGCSRHDNSSDNQGQTTVAAASSSTSDDATAGSDFDSNPSDAPRINVKLVEQALSQVQKSDPTGWVEDFRQRVNEIYDGDDVVSIDAHPDGTNNLQIIGYISHSGKDGFQADSDEQIFTVEQTGAVANDQTPYRMTYTTYGGSASYYDGYYHNPYLTAWYVSALLHHSWGGYYTSTAHIVVIHNYRTTYRTTPAYAQEREATHAYYHQAYHGVTVTSHPGTSLGTGVTIKKGPLAAPAHVSAPPVFTPHATMPHKSVAPSSTAGHSHTAAPDLEHRPGGLFNKNTFGGASKPKSFTPSRSSSGRHK